MFSQAQASFGARWWRILVALPLLVGALATPQASAWTRPVHASIKGATPTVLGADVLPSGDSLVSWRLTDRAPRSIQARIVRPDRSMGPVKVIATPGATPYRPSYAMDSSGNAHYLWDVWDGSSYRARMRTLGVDGTLGPAVTVTPAGENAQAPVFGVDAGGNAVVAWGDGTHIHVRSVGADQTLGPVQDVAPVGSWWQNRDPAIAVDPNGNAVIAWIESQSIDPNWIAGDLWAIRRHSDGTLGNALYAGFNRGPWWHEQLAMDASGDAVFVWSERDEQLFARRWPAGAGLGPEHYLGTANFDPQRFPWGSAVDTAGTALIVWQGHGGGGMGTTTMSPTGELTETPAPFPMGDGYDIAMDSSGNSVIGWHQYKGMWGDRTWVISRAADGTLSARTLLSGYDHPTGPLVGLNDSGQAVAAWIGPASQPRVQVATGP